MSFRVFFKKSVSWRVVAPSGALLVLASSRRADTQPASSTSEAPFTLSGTRYDESTYLGRLRATFETINPATLFVSDEELKRCQSLLEAFKTGKVSSSVTDSELWAAKATVDSVIHPATGEKKFLPGRMAAFLLANVPICAGMLMHGPTSVYASAFWQWVNQSYNTLANYTNRGGRAVDTSTLMQAYGLAVGTSIAIAMGAAKLVKTYPGLSRFGMFIPYTAVMFAGSCNLAFTRMDELRNGTPVEDADKQQLGMSQNAGRLAVLQTIATRAVFLPIVPLILPPVIMNFLKKNANFAKNRPLAIATELGLIVVCFGVALPCALALLPQKMAIPVSSLEPQFQNLKDKKGRKIETVYANKGL